MLRSRSGGGHRLQPSELEELGRGYRRLTSDLAIARRDFPQDRVTRYLEQLAGRAHPAVYQREAGRWGDVLEFFTTGFPQAFRDAAAYTAIAFALFSGPFLAVFLAIQLDPSLGRIMPLPPAFVDGVERGENWLRIEGPSRSLAASLIMVNNIQVAFLAFAGGVLLGLGTVYVLVNNGLAIGATSGLAAAYGLGGPLVDFVSAHGGIELTVVFIAGGAGLRLGHSVLAPGLCTRASALALAARGAVRLLFGCVPLLMIAGTLEGFVSPSSLPTAAKLGVGGTATILLYAYLLLAGRRNQ